MDQDETGRMLQAVLGRVEEQSAMLTGVAKNVTQLMSDVSVLKSDVAELKVDVAGLRMDLQAFRQETSERFDRVDGKLEWLTAKVTEHDEAIK